MLFVPMVFLHLDLDLHLHVLDADGHAGLGGGSLINAGVFLKATPDVIGMSAWPEQIREDPLDECIYLSILRLERTISNSRQTTPAHHPCSNPQYTQKHTR